MASPQKEHGYTSIANELLEKIYGAPLNGSEFRICLMVIRKTYGFKKKEDWISLTQLSQGTGLKRANICRTLKDLVANKLLLKNNNRLKFNKNYDEWVVAKRLPSSQQGNQGSSQTGHLPSSQLATYKRNITKEIITKEQLEKNLKNIKDKLTLKR